VSPASAPLAVELLGGSAVTADWTQRIATVVQALTTNQSAAAGLSARAVALAEGVMLDMLCAKLKGSALVLLSLCLAGLGFFATGRMIPARPAAARAEKEADPEAPREKPAAPDEKADPVEEAVHRARVRQQLRTLGQALENYQAAYNHLPAPAIVSADGKPLLSWRVAILPFIEQDALFKAFHLEEAWDSPHNKKLIERMPSVYAPVKKTPRPHETWFQFIVGPGAVFTSHERIVPALGSEGSTLRPSMGGSKAGPPGPMAGPMRPRPADDHPVIPTSFPDGTANTILLVEAGAPVVWTKPDDVPYHPKKPLPRLGGQFASVVHLLTADQSVRTLPQRLLDERTLRAAITPAGGEPLNMDRLALAFSPGAALRESMVNRIRVRNTRLKEEAVLLKEALAELKQEVQGLRLAVEEEKLLSLDPQTAAMQKENVQLEKMLREAREEARKLLGEINRLKEELRKRKK
jgi:hypothetical protein